MADKIKTTNPYSGESTMLTQTEYNGTPFAERGPAVQLIIDF